LAHVAGFLVDTCVLLPHRLPATQEACLRFLDEGKKYFIVPSVKKEVLDLTKDASATIRTSVRDYVKAALGRNGLKDITNESGTALANAFTAEKCRLHKEFPVSSGIRGDLIGVLENFIANEVHNLQVGQSVPVDDLLSKALVELETARHKLEKPFKGAEMIAIEPDKDLLSLKPLPQTVHNKKDILHLASAIKHQFLFNQWVIFVTTDERDIAVNQKEIWETFGLQCTKPCWAIDYYNEMVKFKAPVEFYREKMILTPNQREFGETIERLLNTRILRQPFKSEIGAAKEKTIPKY
jgi:hypothetical protein